MLANVKSIWLGGYGTGPRKAKYMRLATEQKSVIVTIASKERDTRETVKDEKTGKMVENENFGKFIRKTEHSIELFDTDEKEVKEAVMRGINGAVKGGK
jgi:hypothetical protein